MTNIVVESFTMNHTTVEAPFVRRCGTVTTPQGDIISKFDLRFTQPNAEIMPTDAVHALEHLLAGFLREELSDVVDISPMGCRTGFYLIKVGEVSQTEVTQALVNALRKVLASTEVPAANDVQCGNYRDLSLAGAHKYANQVLTRLPIKRG